MNWTSCLYLPGLALTLLLTSSASAQPAWTYPPEFEDARVHTYRTVGDVELKAWVFAPRQSAPADGYPAVVFFFGGGWRGGTPAQFAEQCRYLRQRGVVAVTCDYRVASRQGVQAVDCVADARAAIRWVRSHAQELGVNSDRICASGGSAGGHIACCTGVVADQEIKGNGANIRSVPNAMALFNPAVMLAPLDGFDLPAAQRKRLQGLRERTGVEPVAISPIHHIAADQPPTLIFHGTADTVVPIAGVAEFARRSQAAGNDVTLIRYPGAPHGFFNNRGKSPQQRDQALQWYRGTLEQLDRFLVRLGWLDGEPHVRAAGRYLRVRRYLDQSRYQFETQHAGRVAFLGGSITVMNGYRPIVESWLTEQFPDTQFDFINAGISSTCSHAGAFRLEQDVLQRGRVDLLLVEFAVNDDQDAQHTAANCLRGMEGVIRRALISNPKMDIVMIHFPNDDMLEQIEMGNEPISSRQHERVARHYGVSSLYLSRYVADAIRDGRTSWEEYGGTHPKQPGSVLTAGLVSDLLDAGWRGGCDIRAADDPEMPGLLDAGSFVEGRLVPAKEANVTTSAGWHQSVPNWKELPGSKRSRYTAEVMLHADEPGATLDFGFSGTAIGAWVLAGPDAGMIEYRIDGGEWRTMELLHHYSRGLHYPRTVMFGTGLQSGPHQLQLRTRPPESKDRGGAARILAFAVNGQ